MKRTLKTYTDQELLESYDKNNESEYLAELYSRYIPLVYGVALKYLKNTEDAQDAVMQIWEGLPGRISKYRIRIFKPWLYVCVRNYCLMELRRNAGNSFVQLDEKIMEFCDDFDPMNKEAGEERIKAVEECIKTLPPKQQTCIHYFYSEELSYKEIEEKSGFSLKMVKSFIQNGKRNLRLCLEHKGISNR